MRAVDEQSAQKGESFAQHTGTCVFPTCVCVGPNTTEPIRASNSTISSDMNINKSLGFTGSARLARGNSPVSDLQYNLCFLNQDNIEVCTVLPRSHSKNLVGQRSWFMIEIARGENGKV